ncbi:MAG: hypothetical protein P4L41_02860 [Flavipsychrobacter sp.]|nr:hypothetical protein [Flavipsychrobacter sp.]
MKKKNTTILLLIIVVLLWGFIGFKFYKGIIASHQNSTLSKKAILTEQIDTIEENFVLHTYSRDPFLSILKDTISSPITDPPVVKETKKIIKKPFIPPAYCGIIKNEREKIAVLFLNKRTFFVKERESLNDFKIKRISDSNIQITNQGDLILIPFKRRIR